MYLEDPWPTMPDGTDFDGKHLLSLFRAGKSPFESAWDVNQLIQELEGSLGATVTDMPFVYRGSNNYGFHVKLSNGLDIVARLARGDVNMPDYNGFPIHVQIPEVKFEAAVYKLLRSEPNILCSRLLYHRVPLQHAVRCDPPTDIAGRRLLVFERAQGENNVWFDLDLEHKAHLLAQSARVRASLFNFQLPLDFAAAWFHERLFEQKPESLPVPVAPTREFCVALFTAKVEATIRNLGDMIGWESDEVTVGPVALAAKQSLLRFIPHMMPVDAGQASLYTKPITHVQYMEYSKHYFEAIYSHAPDYKCAVQAGKDARHLWFALRDWRGADPESYFGDLGSWAELRMKELGVA